MLEVHKRGDYLGGDIVVRHIIGVFWEYVMWKDGQFYSAYAVLRPQWWRRFFKNQYTKAQIDGVCNWLINAACATAEGLDKIKEKKVVAAQKRAAKAKKKR